MNFYILVTYGRKPSGSLMGFPAARQQLANIRYLLHKARIGMDHPVTYDYTRQITSLSSLPNLKKRLVAAREQNQIVTIDDFRRIFTKCPLEKRANLLNELHDYFAHFQDIRLGADLGSLSGDQKKFILFAESPIKFVFGKQLRMKNSKDDLLDQTRNATIASRKARNEAANNKAGELLKLKAELETSFGKVTLTAIANAANERGLKTTRNGEWSASTVSRALERLKK